jgi:hypothetical protein
MTMTVFFVCLFVFFWKQGLCLQIVKPDKKFTKKQCSILVFNEKYLFVQLPKWSNLFLSWFLLFCFVLKNSIKLKILIVHVQKEIIPQPYMINALYM